MVSNKNEIMLTCDVLDRYKISRSTLYFWSTPSRMPACFSRPFPQPAIGGSPKRWRTSDIMIWENEVNAAPAGDRKHSPGGQPTPSASGADLPGNRGDCNEP